MIASADVVGPLNAENAAVAIGDAGEAYAVGQTALFVVDDGISSAVFYFVAADADATVSAGELTLLVTLEGSVGVGVGDVVLGG